MAPHREHHRLRLGLPGHRRRRAAWWILHARLVAEDAEDDARLFLTVAFADEADRDWALEVWRSVTFGS